MSKFIIEVPDQYDKQICHSVLTDVAGGRYYGLNTIGMKKITEDDEETVITPKVTAKNLTEEQYKRLLKAIFDDDDSRAMPCEKCEYGEEMEKLSTTIKTLMEQYLAVPICLMHDYNNAIRKCSEKDCDTIEDADSSDS